MNLEPRRPCRNYSTESDNKQRECKGFKSFNRECARINANKPSFLGEPTPDGQIQAGRMIPKIRNHFNSRACGASRPAFIRG